MKQSRHKYFRQQRYKQKLENKYDQGYNKTYPVNIVFYTKEETNDTENLTSYCCQRYDGRYDFYERPQGCYSINKCYRKREDVKKFFKKYSNKVVRRSSSLTNRAQYKKIVGIWYKIY